MVYVDGSTLTPRSAARVKTDSKEKTETKSVVLNSDSYEAAYKPPPFTLKELRDCIPPECFQRNLFISFAYVLMDAALVGGLFLLATQIDGLALPDLVKWLVLWPAYWMAQGAVFFGVFVLGHECGHQAFSDYPWINHAVGFVLHSFLLVPYYSWKITHSKHHKHTGHMTKDMVFVPWTRSKLGLSKTFHETDEQISFMARPLYYLSRLIGQQLFGWPMYLTINAWGQDYKGRGWVSHFNTASPIFDGAKHAMQVIMSDIGMVIMLSILGYAGYNYGFWAVFKYYFVAYLVGNHWLVMITYLQHTDVRVPHYSAKEWDFLKGALCTVDRDFGILNFIQHHITDTHICHHLFSTIPHYNAVKATKALKKKLGPYYLSDNSNIWLALLRSQQACGFVEDEGLQPQDKQSL